MNTPSAAHSERVLTSLLLMAMILAGVVLVREGPHFDNTVDGSRFFTIAFFMGALTGFLGWSQLFRITPTFSISGAYRQPWLAAIMLGLVAASAGCYVNRTFTTPTERSITAAIDWIEPGRGDRWHVTVTLPNRQRERFFITEQAATSLKNEKAVRMHLARGALGFDYITRFEPLRQ